MRLGLRLLFGFFVIAGIAAFFVLRVFVLEVRPSVREVMEDMLVDTANILAELARADLRSMPSGGTLAGTAFALAVQEYAVRPVQARIRELNKQTLDYRVVVTDATGRVVFDSGSPGSPGGPNAITSAVGQDYSRWRDVALTLQGQYGARTTREVSTDGQSTVLVVAAPVRDGTALIGVLSVAKPMSTVQKFVDRAERHILAQGAWLLALSLAVGVAVTLWKVWQVRRLRNYAQQVQFGERVAPPKMPGELGELAQAMDNMRERLQDHRHLENTVRALTHELKSPMAAIAGAAELLHDELPARDREAFALQITAQVQRQRELVERLLELSKLEHRRVLEHSRRLDLGELVDAVLQRAQAPLHQRAGATAPARPARAVAAARGRADPGRARTAGAGRGQCAEQRHRLLTCRRHVGAERARPRPARGVQLARPWPRRAGLCTAAPG